MYDHDTTAEPETNALRSPFGEKHYRAVRAILPGDSQRKNLMDGKPCVYDTLARHWDYLSSVATDEQFDLMLQSLVDGAKARRRRKQGEPTEALHVIAEMDESAEGFEDQAEVAAVAAMSDPGVPKVEKLRKLNTLHERVVASRSVKDRMLSVIRRETSRLLHRSA